MSQKEASDSDVEQAVNPDVFSVEEDTITNLKEKASSLPLKALVAGFAGIALLAALLLNRGAAKDAASKAADSAGAKSKGAVKTALGVAASVVLWTAVAGLVFAEALLISVVGLITLRAVAAVARRLVD